MRCDNSKICCGRGPGLRAASAGRSRRLLAVALLGVSAWLPACASQVPQREALSGFGRGYERGQGASWESVMSSPEVTARMGETDPGQLPEFARSDGRLSIETNGPILASDAWPEPYRPDLESRRQLYIRDRNGTFTFFGVGARYGDDGYGYRRGIRRGWTGWNSCP